jgi:hypothetical protein
LVKVVDSFGDGRMWLAGYDGVTVKSTMGEIADAAFAGLRERGAT